MKGKSVLVDFYNLHLRSDLGINNPPNEKERQQIRTFFENHAPNVVRKLTDQRKQQIRDYFCYDKIEVVEAEVVVDGFNTLQGYEAMGVSWFDTTYFQRFAAEYHHIKELIDKYLDDDKGVANADIDWLESRINMHLDADLNYSDAIYHRDMGFDSQVVSGLLKHFHNENFNEISKFGIPLPFPSIYKEAMSMLKGELDIQRCQWTECNNILFKTGRRLTCSTKCAKKVKLENDRERARLEAEPIHQALCYLVDKWLNLSEDDKWLNKWLKGEGEWIEAKELKTNLLHVADIEGSYKLRNTETPFLGGTTANNLGKYLPQVKGNLQEMGISVEIKKRKSGYLYRFTRTQ